MARLTRAAFAALAAALVACAVPALAQRPNIVLIVADDLGYFDVGAYGSPVINTPHIDRLAQEGTRFTQWYAPSGLCTPSRGAMLTGRYAQRLGLYTTFDPPADLLFRVFYPSSVGGLPPNELTLAAALKPYGYHSSIIGKWHLGHNGSLPTDRGFDYFFGTPYSHDEGYPGAFPMALIWPPVPVYRNEEIVEQPIQMETITPRMTQEALDVIDQNSAEGRPFFMYLAYHEPHIPGFSTPENEGRSRGGRYGDMVEQMDDSIGVIMERIRRIGNTVVFFTSDNGAWPNAREPFSPELDGQGDGGSNGAFFEGKASTWEGGMRTPAIAWFPGQIPPNRVVRDMASHVDLFPTFLSFANVPVPSDRVIDGVSLVEMFTGRTESSSINFHFYWRERTLMAVRYGRYKFEDAHGGQLADTRRALQGHFVTRSGFGSEEPTNHDPMLLFDVEKDLSEQYPLNVTKFPDVVNTILQAAQSHIAQMEWGPPQFDVGGTLLGQSWQVVPCCQRQQLLLCQARKGVCVDNRSFYLPFQLAPFMNEPEPPEDWSLIIWENCICKPTNGTVRSSLRYQAPQAFAGTSFRGRPLEEYRLVMTKAQLERQAQAGQQ